MRLADSGARSLCGTSVWWTEDQNIKAAFSTVNAREAEGSNPINKRRKQGINQTIIVRFSSFFRNFGKFSSPFSVLSELLTRLYPWTSFLILFSTTFMQNHSKCLLFSEVLIHYYINSAEDAYLHKLILIRYNRGVVKNTWNLKPRKLKLYLANVIPAVSILITTSVRS